MAERPIEDYFEYNRNILCKKKNQEMENIESLTFSIVVTFQIKIHY